VTNRILLAVTLAALPLVACYEAEPTTATATGSIDDGTACPKTIWTLTAGQTHEVGNVYVTNDADNLYITLDVTYPGATFGNLHVWVGNSLLNLPTNSQGIPVPGQFCQADGGKCFDATGETSFTFTFSFAELNIVDVSQVCGLDLYIVTHAEVNVDLDGDGQIEAQTAFGGDTAGAGPRWWFYGSYAVCCGTGEPEPVTCETAFAKGGWVWTTNRKSNPESLPSLDLTRNRWGWAINLTSTGHSEYPIYAGAGLNKISNGTLVGTLDVDWDGALATVRYQMLPGYSMEEVHLYAADGAPLTIAPGQYGNLDSFDPAASSYTFTVELSDADAAGGVWLVAHAAVCY